MTHIILQYLDVLDFASTVTQAKGAALSNDVLMKNYVVSTITNALIVLAEYLYQQIVLYRNQLMVLLFNQHLFVSIVKYFIWLHLMYASKHHRPKRIKTKSIAKRKPSWTKPLGFFIWFSER